MSRQYSSRFRSNRTGDDRSVRPQNFYYQDQYNPQSVQQNPSKQHGYQQNSRYHHRAQPGRQKQPLQKPKESQMDIEARFAAQYTLDTVSQQQLQQLDIFNYLIDDLLKPGKGVVHLYQIMAVAENHYKTKQPTFEVKSLVGEWYGFLTIYYPETKTFTCKHRNKKECKNLASLAAIHYLRTNSTVDKQLKISLKTSLESFSDNSRGPVLIPMIPMNLKQQIMSFISKYNECVADLIEYRIDASRKNFEMFDPGLEGKHAAILEGLDPDESTFDSANEGSVPEPARQSLNGPIDIFTSRPYKTPEPSKKAQAFTALKDMYIDRNMKEETDPSFATIMINQGKLPIRSYGKNILQALRNHRAIVVAGDTGCGKSTQVPQFLMEEFVQNQNSNVHINIAITEPRRISAISLAERVAVELGEKAAGQTVGHCVRFDSRMPRRDLNIMTFFTTGMLLKKLQSNPDLKGVTHLVIDEVHERDCTTDFLLILIKRLLQRTRDLRVIFMSASIDANLFARYFDNCPIVSVPGRCFPVADTFLEDLKPEIRREYSPVAPKLNIQLLNWLIEYIDTTRQDGAILCFMPGWKEMKSLSEELQRSRRKLKIFMTHSKLPIHEQRLIFSKPGPGERKVILATNIAETSITINDVCYVIDTGLCNSIDYDPELNISTFGTRWISKANAKQRSGRAGRAAPGECFKLYTRHEESNFTEYPFPELLRIPLESVIMDAKCHCPGEKAVDFLCQAIQHPSVSAIHSALDELQFLGVLDYNEHLTTLGRRISNFTTHPRLSVALVTATALRCLYPVLNATAMLASTQDPFILSLTEKCEIRATKTRLCKEVVGPNSDLSNYMSDHIALANLLAQYDNACESRSEQEYFVRKNGLNPSAMANMQTCRNYHANMMISAKFSNSYEWYSMDAFPNKNMNDLELFIGCMVHSLYPKLVRLIKGTIKNNRLYPDKVSSTDILSNKKVRFVSDSIVRSVSLGKPCDKLKDYNSDSDGGSDYASMETSNGNLPPCFITYMNSRVDQESNLIVIRDGSVVPTLVLALFGGQDFFVFESGKNQQSSSGCEDNYVTIMLDRQSLVSFKCSIEDAKILKDWRRIWHTYFDWFIHTKNSSQPVDSNDAIIAQTMNDFLDITKKLFLTTT